MLDLFDTTGRRARVEGMDVPPFETMLLWRCRERRDRQSAVVAAGLAAVAPPEHERLAASVAGELRASVRSAPAWLERVGRVAPTRAWVASDVFGDQDSLIIGFGLPAPGGQPGPQPGREPGDQPDHALVVLVDHNLSGQAKDAWIASDVQHVVTEWRNSLEPHTRLEEVPVDSVLARLRDAMAASDLWNGDTELRTEDFARHRALIWARLRRAGITGDSPSDLEVTEAQRQAIVSDFLGSMVGRRLAEKCPGRVLEMLARSVVDLRSDFEGRPLRWSPIVVSGLLGDLAPRKLLLDADQAAALPDVVRAFVEFSTERTGLEPEMVHEILAAIDRVELHFLDLMADPSAAGPAKAVLAALRGRGVDLTDLDAVNQALESGEPIELPAAPPKRRPRRSVPADVITSADGAPVLARFEILTGFYGEGRKLTQTGQPTLADAKELVSCLGTADRVDEMIGDRIFKTKSAAELPELGFMIRWAVSSGALRKQHGKLLATKAWAKLDGKPLERWSKAAESLAELGPLAGFHTNNRYRGRDEILDELAAPILHMLIPGPMAFDEILDRVCGFADDAYEWLAPYMQDPERRRDSLGWDLGLLARILGWAGISERVGATIESDRYRTERVVGGTLQLTPAGRWWLDDR